MSDFESLSKKKGGTYEYDPKKNAGDDPMVGHRGETLTPYFGPVLGPPVCHELQTWAKVLEALKDGLPKPFDNTVILNKIRKIEEKTGDDLGELKNCCPPSAEVREAKEFKPLIFAIIDRIIEIGQIEKYVEKHEI